MSISAKALEFVAAKIVEKDAENGYLLIGAILGIVALPCILIVGMFSSGGLIDKEHDPYIKAFQEVGCNQSSFYTLEDMRFFNSFTVPNGEDNLSQEEIKQRMESFYYYISIPKTDGIIVNQNKVCLLKSDDEIMDVLVKEYNVVEEERESILESLAQMRNGRSNFDMPLQEFEGVKHHYKFENNEGVWLSGTEESEVVSVLDGEVVDIVTSNEKVKYVEDDVMIDKSKGLSIKVKHVLNQEINDDGEYNQISVYTVYSNLKNISLSVGDVIERGSIIGEAKESVLYFEVQNDMQENVDPALYLYLGSNEIHMPLDEPFQFTSPTGDRDIGYHYGIDLSKEFGADIKAMLSGKVLEVNTTCSPNGGPSSCPSTGQVQGGGNYVVIQHEYEGETYYVHYAHMEEVLVTKGQNVYAGQLIGKQGNSGNSYGSHVHIEAHTEAINTADKETMVDVAEWLELEK